jgi:hypothetical protein
MLWFERRQSLRDDGSFLSVLIYRSISIIISNFQFAVIGWVLYSTGNGTEIPNIDYLGFDVHRATMINTCIAFGKGLSWVLGKYIDRDCDNCCQTSRAAEYEVIQ